MPWATVKVKRADGQPAKCRCGCRRLLHWYDTTVKQWTVECLLCGRKVRGDDSEGVLQTWAQEQSE